MPDSIIGHQTVKAVFKGGQVVLLEPVDLPDGTELVVSVKPNHPTSEQLSGPAIVAGFGLSGRCVADLMDQANVAYTIIERNPTTVETQRELGRQIIEGDVTDPATLIAAGLHNATMLALTIPDEEAVIRATAIARRMRPNLFIMARTLHASKGMQASQAGADRVIKAEQAVAQLFYEYLHQRLIEEAND